MLTNGTPQPQRPFFHRVTQSKIGQAISRRWRSHRLRKHDPLGAILADAAKLLIDKDPLLDESLEERKAEAVNIDAVFSDKGSAWERLKEGASEIKANVKHHAKRGAIAGAIGGGLTGLALGVIGGLGAGATLGPGGFIAGLIGPGLMFAGIGAVAGAVGGALVGLCRSAYYLIANPEAKALLQLKRLMKEYNKVALAIKNNRAKEGQDINKLKSLWLDIQGLRMGILAWRYNKTEEETKKLLEAIQKGPGPHNKIVKKHLKKGADPFMLVHSNSTNKENAPLLQICQLGDSKSFQIMLKAAEEKGNYPSLTTIQTLLNAIKPLEHSLLTEGQDIIKQHLERMKKNIENCSSQLCEICRRDDAEPDLKQVVLHLEAGADPLHPDESTLENKDRPEKPMHALGWACHMGHANAFAAMVRKTPLTLEQIKAFKNTARQKKETLSDSSQKKNYEKIIRILNTALEAPTDQRKTWDRIKDIPDQLAPTEDEKILLDTDTAGFSPSVSAALQNLSLTGCIISSDERLLKQDPTSIVRPT